MLFIFGWGRQTSKQHGPVYKCKCSHCNNTEYFQLYSRRTWFTLFFIPVIPYSTQHMLICPICSYGFNLEESKFNECKVIADCNVDYINKRITETEYEQRINNLKSINTYDTLSDKTETQRNYLKQIQEFEENKSEI